jgi:tetratricopeptide (TPR) repeat protein
MNAVISGLAGVAFVMDGDWFASMHAGDLAVLVPRAPGDYPYLFADAGDLQFLEDVEPAEVVRWLGLAGDQADALQLTLILLDPLLSEQVRRGAAVDLEELYANPEVLAHVERVLFAQPLSPEADLPGAQALTAGQQTFDRVQAFLHRLVCLQPRIREVHEAWTLIPDEEFAGSSMSRREFESVALREGVFRDIVTSPLDAGSFSDLLLRAWRNPRIQTLPNCRRVLKAWFEPLRKAGAALPALIDDDAEGDLAGRAASRMAEKLKESRFRGIDREQVLAKVESQKNAIVALMGERNLVLVRKRVAELIAYQKDRGETVYICKSLCGLAQSAKELGLPELQLELTERSIEEKRDDGWSWTQYADALLRNSRLTEALEAYSQAEAFGGGNVVARCGRAEALRAMNRLGDALDAYEQTIHDFPDSVIARNGRAEALRAMNRLDDALDAYDQALRDFPENVVARNGRAEMLRAMNRLEDALVAYDQAIRDFSGDVVARSGRAETLRAMNRLDDALAAYDQAICDFPISVIARNGRAETLRAMNRLDDALAAYDQALRDFPENVVARNGRAETLRAMNRLDDALAAYEQVIRDFPRDVVARCGRAETLRAMNRLDDALAAYEEAVHDFPYSVIARNGRAWALAALERWDEALEGLPDLVPVSHQDWIGFHMRGMILLRRGDADSAIELLRVGVERNTSPSQQDYFRSALAVALIVKRQFQSAGEMITAIVQPTLAVEASLLNLHVFGEMSIGNRAIEAYERLPQLGPPPFEDLRDELYRRYILRRPAEHDDQWVFVAELECIRQAA